jgi:hypothetical protein
MLSCCTNRPFGINIQKIPEPAMVCFNGDSFHFESDSFFQAGLEIGFKEPFAPSNGVMIIASV